MLAADAVPPSRLDAACGHALARIGGPFLLASLVVMAVPVWLGLTPARSLLVFVPLAGIGWWLSRQHAADTRARLIGVLGLALLIRLLTLTIGVALGSRAGLDQLGPDGVVYWQQSVELSRAPWSLPAPYVLGAMDVGHYHLFAAVLRLLHTDLFGLRLLNAGLDTLTAGVAYSTYLMILPRRAALAAVLTAVHMPLVVMATLDLWKDPSAILAVMVTIWAVLRLAQATRPAAMALLGLLAAASLTYVHCTRPYWAFYLEVSGVAAAILMVVAGLSWRTWRRAALAALVALTVSEAVPRSLGWPFTPEIFLKQFTHVRTTTQMRALPTGAMDDVITAKAPPPSDATRVPADEASRWRDGLSRAPALALAVFRKVWGPYVWILPGSLSAADVLRGDYLYYPGMLVWYWLLPSFVVGVGATLLQSVRGRWQSWPLCWLAIYLIISAAQYLVLNLPFRQRDGAFPLLILFGLLGWALGRQSRWWIRLHVAYVAGLAILAATHLWLGPAPL
jgi:hypothetical protein